MSAIAHVGRPAAHAAKNLLQHIDGGRAGASMLLAAIVAALLVVANQIIDTWTEGHLLAAWIAMWTIGFAALALLASPAKRMSGSLRGGLSRWQAARRRAAADERMWQVALTDARVMADISRAMSQSAAQDVRGSF